MKTGDIVYCKKKYTYTGVTPNRKFKFGESYVISDILYENAIIRINDVLFNNINLYDRRCFAEYFETEKEHRARKLRLLNLK